MASLIPSGNAAGTGSMTLSAPATNSNQVATLPDATGTVMVTGAMPAFSAYQNSSQSISANTWTKTQIDTKVFDTATCFNTTTYRFTPTVAGYYQLNASYVYGTGVANSLVTLGIYKNGAIAVQGPQYNATATVYVNTAAGLVYLNGSTDYVELYVYCSTSFTATASASSSFNGTLVRAA